MHKTDDILDLNYQLDDRYQRDQGQIFLTGTQALVRIPLMQAQVDKNQNLNTAGFISGYRGSPLGNYDRELWQAQKHLDHHGVKFQPGINEELAATAVLGSQQVESSGFADYDGVFGIWYGKGPGVDRASDALKHGNAFGSSQNGGVLVIAGDDHAAVSSSMNHQSEQIMASWMMPILAPAGLQDYLDFGLYGIALSRYSGCWSGFVAVSEIVESAATVNLDLVKKDFITPEHEGYSAQALHYRWPDPLPLIEGRLIDHKLKAVHAFVRANPIDNTLWSGKDKRLGLVTCGKAYLDLMQAFANAGISREEAEDAGISIFKVGLTWPLEPTGISAFANGFEKILVVEEKRSFVENQLRDILYNAPEKNRPVIIGKNTEDGAMLLNPVGELSPEDILKALSPYLNALGLKGPLDQINQNVSTSLTLARDAEQLDRRTPYFCSGCPHSSSTKVPEGSRAMAGIGCHFLATNMNRNTDYLCQMGGEGVNWMGQSPFTHEDHIFQNLGDGTYYHSGLLAIRQSVAGGANITYKLLYNDAIAMTGGQPLENTLTVDQISHQFYHEGVKPIYVVTDEPDKYEGWANFAPGVSIHHRSEMDQIQRKLRKVKGVSGLIYDQTCASEKRRRRKKKQFPDPPKRAFINELVCEACGDCSVQSNCLSIIPVETEFGQKRSIDQSSCNKDYSCINGFCPSFVSIHGGQVKKGSSTDPKVLMDNLPDPQFRALDNSYDIMITGVGGTGVVTIGQIIVMAAHLQGMGATALDFTGFAQKGGAVISYLRLANKADQLKSVRIGTAQADLLLGCDMVVAGSAESLRTLNKENSTVVLNAHKIQTAQFVLNRDADIHDDLISQNINNIVGTDALHKIEATRLATQLMGDSIATNMFLFGYAWQLGQIPVSLAAINRAIELNGVAIEKNRQSFNWGRIAAHDIKLLEDFLPHNNTEQKIAATLEDIITVRADYLRDYQDDALAEKYRKTVGKMQQTLKHKGIEGTELITAVAKNYFKLLAVKDEYEVARLYTDGRFLKNLQAQFEGDYKIHFHMAPPLLARRNDKGELQKKEFGPWMMPGLKLMARLRFLRGTAFDLFGYTAERKMERQLIRDYEELLKHIDRDLSAESLEVFAELAALPTDIRGFGHVKEKAVKNSRIKARALTKSLSDSTNQSNAAE